MRTNWRENQHPEAWIDDGAARAQRVRGRAGRRRNDKTIGAILAKSLSVGGDLELHHAALRALVEHRIVEREKLLEHLGAAASAATDIRLQRDAAIGFVIAHQHPLECLLRFAGARLGEKSQPTEVDAENRGLALADLARDSEQGA